MFQFLSNATFNNGSFSCWTIENMHSSAVRLYEVAKEQAPPISGQSAVARWLDESPQVVKNWESRGVSKQGALKLQQKTGVSATWLLRGEGPRTASQPAPAGRKLDAQLLQLLDDLEDIPEKTKSALIDHVHEIAEQAREAHAHLSRRKQTATPAKQAAARKSAVSKHTAQIRYGDGNSRQHALPLTTVADPFTAQPDQRELALYHHIAMAPKGDPGRD